MIEYETREDAERDPELNLMYMYKCPKCGHEYEDYPNCNENSPCNCGEIHEKVGESYNAM